MNSAHPINRFAAVVADAGGEVLRTLQHVAQRAAFHPCRAAGQRVRLADWERMANGYH
jgi:hypothetical protein